MNTTPYSTNSPAIVKSPIRATPRHEMKRQIRNPQAWIGKRINLCTWEIPDGYHLCAKTGKLHAEDDLLVTFAHHTFEREWLISKRIYIEDADWLSSEGYDEIMDVLKREGRYEYYIEHAFGRRALESEGK
jgi:hypothetical protein